MTELIVLSVCKLYRVLILFLVKGMILQRAVRGQILSKDGDVVPDILRSLYIVVYQAYPAWKTNGGGSRRYIRTEKIWYNITIF